MQLTGGGAVPSVKFLRTLRSEGAMMGAMRGWRVVVVSVTLAACRAPAPAATPPRPPPPPVWETVAAPYVPQKTLAELVERPAWMLPQTPVADEASAWVDALPPSLRPALPRVHAVLALVRPRAGGEALDLADLALSRGDALDAAAQYRAVLGTGAQPYAAYVRVQLARAYLALGDEALALPHLRAATMASGPEAWAALCRLAELRAAEVGTVAAADELRGLAGSRVESLEAFLVSRSTPDEAATLLVVMAARTRSCAYVLQAVEFGLQALPVWLDRDCRAVVFATSREAVATRSERGDRVAAYGRRFDAAAAVWGDLASSVVAGDLAAAPWLALAEEYLAMRRIGVHAGLNAGASLGASAAVFVALDLAGRSGRIDEAQRAGLAYVIDQLDGSDRELAMRRLSKLVHRRRVSP